MSGSIFPLLGEPLALDLVNTRVRCGDGIVDMLDSPSRLDAWLRAERHRIAWAGHASRGDLAALRALRDALDALLHAPLRRADPPIAAVKALNRALAARVPSPRLAWTGGSACRAPPPARARRTLLLHQLARDALDLLTRPHAARVRKCAHPDCILLFVARDARRQWCSSATCGNRARVARHYARGHGA